MPRAFLSSARGSRAAWKAHSIGVSSRQCGIGSVAGQRQGRSVDVPVMQAFVVVSMASVITSSLVRHFSSEAPLKNWSGGPRARVLMTSPTGA
jgi:hypothetical protein